MNPLDLRGPQFLLFYAILAAVVLVAVRLGRRLPDVSGLPARLDDPCLLAALRDGPVEAIRVATLSLLDRRLLKARDGKLVALARPEAVRRPLERAVLAVFQAEGPSYRVFAHPGILDAAFAVEGELARAGLVADAALTARRGLARWLGAGVLLGVAAAKVAVASARGRHNVGFLVVGAVLATFLSLAVGTPARRTSRGEKALELAGRAYRRLRDRAAALVPGGAADELALAAGVFGLGVLPPLGQDLVTEAGLRPPPGSHGSSWVGSSGGDSPWGSWSSCSTGGSSCASSSSCGGGGCGGGGGGCGGCGS